MKPKTFQNSKKLSSRILYNKIIYRNNNSKRQLISKDQFDEAFCQYLIVGADYAKAVKTLEPMMLIYGNKHTISI